jgi:hypothetical protein
MTEAPEHRCLIDAGILLEDGVPDQFLCRPSPVTRRRGIHIHVVPVVADDLKPFLEAVERPTNGVVAERGREYTNEL